MRRVEVIKCLKREINKRNNGIRIKNSDIVVQGDIPEEIKKIKEWKLIKVIEHELEDQYRIFYGMHHWSYEGTWQDFKRKGMGNIKNVRVQWNGTNLEIFFNKSEDSIQSAIRERRNAGGYSLTH